jgi:peptidoglycan hydrolase CwlO-like protein
MNVWVSVLISGIAAAFAIYLGLKNNQRADVKDIEEKAARDAKINIKLDDISSDVKDIKYDVSATNKKVEEIDRRVVVVEQSTKSAHHRIDRIEGREEKAI